MINPYAVDLALRYHPLYARMGCVGHLRPLRANPNQRVDVEESPIVGELARQLPAVQQVVLPAQNRIETRHIALHARDCLLQPPALRRCGKNLACPRCMAMIGAALFLPRGLDAAQTLELVEATLRAPGQQLTPGCR